MFLTSIIGILFPKVGLWSEGTLEDIVMLLEAHVDKDKVAGSTVGNILCFYLFYFLFHFRPFAEKAHLMTVLSHLINFVSYFFENVTRSRDSLI